MMVRKEDRSQLLKLAGAIVAVFGCAAWRVVGAAQPAAAPPPADGAAPAASADAPPVPGAAKPEDGKIEVARLFVPSSTDPFRIIAGPPPTVPAPVLHPVMTGALPTLPLPTAQPLVPPRETLVPVAKTPIRVTGIVAGTNGMAVLEVDKETRVVHEGTRLADGTVVVRIEPTTVTIRRGGATETLDVNDG